MNVALMFINDFFGNVQSQSAAFACHFCREEGLEDLLLNLFRDTFTGIGNRDNDLSILHSTFDRQDPFLIHCL